MKEAVRINSRPKKNRRQCGKSLFAEYTLKPEAVLQVVGLKAVGTCHIGVAM
jgi:hypothetical protein